MPYRLRRGTAGLIFHVLNRAVRRARLFDNGTDYAAFLMVLREAQRRIPLRILAYCIMPNHFHLVAWPAEDNELSGFMHWLTSTHSKRWHVYHETRGTGSVYQGRFKSFPVQTDSHFLTVCRYVEQNPLRAGLVQRAEDWAWSSLWDHCRNYNRVKLEEWPILRPADWLESVNRLDSIAAPQIRRSILRSRPYGEAGWRERIAGQLGLKSTLRPIGRPKTSGSVLQKT
ncbi:MAG: REP-associated tyrosine transposase [Acidobacteriota bacterium]